MKAFPTTTQWVNGVSPANFDSGMDLRDYFAAKALQGLLSSLGQWTAGIPNHEFSESVAHDAYWIADAMMEARK